MGEIDKSKLTERDICTKFITPALESAGWDLMHQIREEYFFTDGRVMVRGKQIKRGDRKFADYLLLHKSGRRLAIIEAKDNSHSIGSGMQQALGYALTLDVPFVFSSNGDGFLHDRLATSGVVEQELPLDEFPSPTELWDRYCQAKNITAATLPIVTQPYFSGGREPRYFQQIAIDRTIEAIATGQKRVLLVMATGTGKTYTAFQIIWRLWKSGAAKRILFLADRNILVDQTMVNDFRHLKGAMAKLSPKSKTIRLSDGKEGDVSIAVQKDRTGPDLRTKA